MGGDWTHATLSDVVDIISGGTPKTSTPEYWNGNIPWLSVVDFNTGYRWVSSTEKYITERGLNESATRLLDQRDIIISARGTVGALAQLSKPMAFNQSCYGIRGKHGVSETDFIYYLLKQTVAKMNQVAHGGVFSTITRDTFKLIELPLPPLAEQRAIAHILGTLDDKIELNRRINQTLEAMAQAIFKSWFVGFDPVKAKIAAIAQGQDPLRAAMRAISGKTDAELDQMPREHHDQLAATAALFPDAMQESELGEIPEGWGAVPFGSLLSHTIGGDWGTEAPDAKNDIRVAIIRGTDIPDLDQAQSNRVPIRYTNKKKLATRHLQVGDIVLEVSGGSKGQPTGRSLHMTTNALREFNCPVEPASFCRLLRPISLEVSAVLGLHLSYIYQQGKTWEYQNQSTGIANFQTSHFLEAELIAFPSSAVLEAFFGMVSPILEQRHDAQGQKLAALRDTLLPKLLSGELTMPSMEE